MSQRLFTSVLDDAVFLDDEEKRREYVMYEEGVIYKGSEKYITSMKWDFGQVHTQRGAGLVVLGQQAQKDWSEWIRPLRGPSP